MYSNIHCTHQKKIWEKSNFLPITNEPGIFKTALSTIFWEPVNVQSAIIGLYLWGVSLNVFYFFLSCNVAVSALLSKADILWAGVALKIKLQIIWQFGPVRYHIKLPKIDHPEIHHIKLI